VALVPPSSNWMLPSCGWSCRWPTHSHNVMAGVDYSCMVDNFIKVPTSENYLKYVLRCAHTFNIGLSRDRGANVVLLRSATSNRPLDYATGHDVTNENDYFYYYFFFFFDFSFLKFSTVQLRIFVGRSLDTASVYGFTRTFSSIDISPESPNRNVTIRNAMEFPYRFSRLSRTSSSQRCPSVLDFVVFECVWRYPKA
jgi:hypothetical protein